MSKSTDSLIGRLEDGVVLAAEGYIFELERRGYVKAGPFVPQVVQNRPSALKELHVEFARAGSDVIVACTYYAHRAKLKATGQERLLEEINVQSVAIAKDAAREYGALTAGNLCNTWEYDLEDLDGSRKIVREMFEEQTRWAVDGGVDFIIAETFSHLGEAVIALEVIKEAGVPAVVTFIPLRPMTCDGYAWDEACKILEDNGADVVGLNCGRGPASMLPILEKIRTKVSGHY
ncbi:homocysteine S-methyltransferase family protein [Thermodesulfobacteriota bacterium]